MFKAVACGRRGRSARRANRRFYNPSISSRETAAVRNFAALHFFALHLTTGLKIPGAVIPLNVFTQPGS
jgi:hypothetical protein